MILGMDSSHVFMAHFISTGQKRCRHVIPRLERRVRPLHQLAMDSLISSHKTSNLYQEFVSAGPLETGSSI